MSEWKVQGRREEGAARSGRRVGISPAMSLVNKVEALWMSEADEQPGGNHTAHSEYLSYNTTTQH